VCGAGRTAAYLASAETRASPAPAAQPRPSTLPLPFSSSLKRHAAPVTGRELKGTILRISLLTMAGVLKNVFGGPSPSPVPAKADDGRFAVIYYNCQFLQSRTRLLTHLSSLPFQTLWTSLAHQNRRRSPSRPLHPPRRPQVLYSAFLNLGLPPCRTQNGTGSGSGRRLGTSSRRR